MDAAEDRDDPGTEHWCAGLRFESERPLTAGEALALRSEAGRLLGTLGRLALGATLLVAWPLAASPFASGAPFAAWPWLVGTWLAGGLVGLPLLALVARDVARVRGRLLADLSGGVAHEYAGDLDRVTHEQLEEAGLAALKWDAAGSGARRLVVFPRASLACVRDALGGEKLARVTVREVAAGPGYAMRVPVPRDVLRLVGDPELPIRKRSLTDAERREVGTYAHRLARPDGGMWIGAGLFVLALIGISVALFAPGSAAPRPADVVGALGMLAVGFATGWLYAGRLRLSRRIRRDLEIGWAVAAGEREPALDEQERAARIAISPDDEFLPCSGLRWSESGRPAGWRDLGRAH